MNLLDRLLAWSLPVVPKPIVGAVSKKYIAGESRDDMVRTVQALNAEGALATVDVLGEDTTERRQAEETVIEYERAIEAIVEHDLDCNVSIKLTALGLIIDPSLCRDHVERIVAAAKPHGMFVRFDMEDTSVTTRTLELYEEVRRQHDNVGPVIQSYLRRSKDDAQALLRGAPLNVRLCKGIYREPEELAFQDKEEVRESYKALLRTFLEAGAHVGIATHDDPLIACGEQLVKELGLSRDRYEFQMLLGVIPQTRQRLIEAGHPLRVYVPYGEAWYGYSMRRLRENPKIAGYVFKAMFSGG